jgi:hypothetical protein
MPENQVKIGNVPLNTGITRNTPYGGMEDVVNARYIDGALRPVQKGRRIYNNPGVDGFIIHPVSGVDHWIGYVNEIDSTPGYIEEFRQTDSNGVNLGLQVYTILTLQIGETLVDIKPFRNYIVLTTSLRMYRYLLFDGTYISMDITRPIQVSLEVVNEYYKITDPSTHDPSYTDNGYSCADEIKGFIYEILANESSEFSRLSGAISWVAAYKLNDGTYVMQTTPTIQQGNNYSNGVEAWSMIDGTPSADGGKQVDFWTTKWDIKLTPGYYADMVNEEKLISSICIFFSKPILKYDIEETVTDDNLGVPSGERWYFSKYDKISDDWNNMGSPELGWFLVAEIPFLTIIQSEETTFLATKYLQLENFYSNYATKEALPVDQYTHHSLNAKNIFIYNSRLWLNGVSKTLSSPLQFQPTFSGFYRLTDAYDEITGLGYTPLSLDAIIAFKLTADGQKKTVVSIPISINGFIDGNSNYYAQFPLISYPDDRAYEFSIYLNHSGVWKEYLTHELIKSLTHNFAYYFDINNQTSFEDEIYAGGYILWHITKNLDTIAVVNDPTLQLSNVDASQNNQVQLSALNNPFVFPSSLNYPVGNGSVNWFAVTQDALSEGQFGEFPVVCFCSDGIFALTIAGGEVVVSSVTPVATDIAIGSPTGTSQGIFFASKYGIMVLRGSKVSNISIPLRGKIGVIVSGEDAYFSLYSNHYRVCNLNTIITNLSELQNDMSDMIFAYDHEWERIYATKPGLGYSYVFDILTNTWYRISEDYNYFAIGTGKTYGVNDRGLINLSDLTDNSTIEVHWHTKPMTFNTNHLKKLEETLLKCQIRTNSLSYAAFILFASNDGEKWYRITGNDMKTGEINDIQLTFTHASYKYFVFAFWGRLLAVYDNFFDSIDCEVKERYGHRLRSH